MSLLQLLREPFGALLIDFWCMYTPPEPGTTWLNPRPGFVVVPPGGSKTSTGSIDHLGDFREASWRFWKR